MSDSYIVTLGNGEMMQIPNDKGGILTTRDEQPDKMLQMKGCNIKAKYPRELLRMLVQQYSVIG